ncbi:hypothetical protein NL676_003318 [Syzygium grande]|nr:hypothetical protein NL676_003318 [Syzygium grande]
MAASNTTCLQIWRRVAGYGQTEEDKCLSMADLCPTYGLAVVHGHPCALQIYDESPSRFGGTIVDKPPSPMDAVVVRANHHRP